MTTTKLFLALLCSLPLAAAGQAADAAAAERARIDAKRTRAESEFAAQEKACYAKFAVNDCIEAARVQRRTVLAELRRQEVALADAQRRQRAAERMRAIEARQAEQPTPRRGQEQTRERPAAPAVAAPDQAGVPEPTAAPISAPDTGAGGVAAPATAPAKARWSQPAAQPRQNAQRHQERLLRAQQHKEQAQKRAAENTKQRRPLPVPP